MTAAMDELSGHRVAANYPAMALMLPSMLADAARMRFGSARSVVVLHGYTVPALAADVRRRSATEAGRRFGVSDRVR
jgi:hypothetical protein